MTTAVAHPLELGMHHDRVSQPLFTSSWSQVYRHLKASPGPPAFIPTRISLGKPKFWPEAQGFPYIAELAPLGGLLRVTDREEFTARYVAQLDRIGVAVITEKLEDVALSYMKPLALLCFERVDGKGQWCHRRIFASWWEDRTGVEVPELGDRLPTAASDTPTAGASAR